MVKLIAFFKRIPAEAWFDDTQAMRDLAPSAEYADVRADEPNCTVSGRWPFVVATENEIDIR